MRSTLRMRMPSTARRRPRSIIGAGSTSGSTMRWSRCSRRSRGCPRRNSDGSLRWIISAMSTARWPLCGTCARAMPVPIIQIGSALSYRAIPLQSAYCGAKFAIRGFTEALRSELMHDKLESASSWCNCPRSTRPSSTGLAMSSRTARNPSRRSSRLKRSPISSIALRGGSPRSVDWFSDLEGDYRRYFSAGAPRSLPRARRLRTAVRSRNRATRAPGQFVRGA